MLEPHHLDDKMNINLLWSWVYSAESYIWEDGSELCQSLFFEGWQIVMDYLTYAKVNKQDTELELRSSC